MKYKYLCEKLICRTAGSETTVVVVNTDKEIRNQNLQSWFPELADSLEVLITSVKSQKNVG